MVSQISQKSRENGKNLETARNAVGNVKIQYDMQLSGAEMKPRVQLEKKQSIRADLKKSTPVDCFNPDLPDSDSGKLYILPKCFRDADATVKSVSANSRLKNSVSTITRTLLNWKS